MIMELGDSELKALPRYQLAARHERLLKKLLAVCLFLVASFTAILGLQLLPGLQPVLVVQIAALLILSVNLQSVWWITRWRIRALKAASHLRSGGLDNAGSGLDGASAKASASNQTIDIGEPLTGVSRVTRFRNSLSVCRLSFLTFILRGGDALNLHGTVALSSVACLLVINYWSVPPSGILTLVVGQVPARFLVVISLVIAAFAALVLERYFAHLGGEDSAINRSSTLPEAPHITYQLRVYITLSLLLCIALLLANEARLWPLSLMVWVSFVPAAIAVEFLLRAALSVFTPPPQHEPELLAESILAALWRWPIKPFTHLQDELKQRFGIDLRQSWAFAYIRRSLLSIFGVLLGIAWLLSGLVEIPIAERGIYERFGAPIAVWQPGIHAGLPWPFGRVQRMENGIVHEVSATASELPKKFGEQTEGAGEGLKEPGGGTEDTMSSAEDAPPANANRLWDASHLAEKSQIIASEVTTTEGNRQSFHIVNMDVRFMYRIGLTDGAVLKARYVSVDAQALIRSTANRILVRYFASRTLEGVLGEARTQMAKEIGSQLQADLNTLNSGVEIMTTVLEAIHPPAAAANAYHAVQAAQITAHAIISRERGNAAQQVNLAQLRAGIARNQATASARETIATAEVASRRFIAERDAYQQGGNAFLMEQYFAQLTQGLKSARVLLVDHRLPNVGATVDLRDFAASDKKAGTSPALTPNVDYQESP